MLLSFDDLKRSRLRLLRMHFESGAGHIGGNLSCLDAMMVIHHEYLLSQGDHLILSKGQAAGALYVALWSKGLIDDEDLQRFHSEGTKLPAHPPALGLPRILFATGSLGHGLSLAAGTALAMRFNRNSSHVFCMTSDGEWQEGSTWEALIFLCHHQLANLTILVDNNRLQGFGSTEAVASMTPLTEKLRGFAITVHSIDGHDLSAIRAALDAPSSQPKLIILNTIKGHGVSFMQNRMEWHYLALGREQYEQAAKEVEAAGS